MSATLKEKLFRKRYEIGFAPFSEDIILKGQKPEVRFVCNPPKDKWYADPFLLDVTDDFFVVLVEEFRYEHPKGRIARLVVDRKTVKIVSETIVLDLPTHLSFPIFCREGDVLYIYPENIESGSFSRYRYDKQTDSFVFSEMLVDMPLADVVPFSIDGRKYLLATDGRDDDGSGSTLSVFRYEDASYAHFQEIGFSSKIARNGGAVIKIGENIYRVAQDCTIRYGYALNFQKMVADDNGKFSFETVSKIFPSGLQYATHTFNVCKGWAVVDVEVAVYPVIRHLYFGLASRFKKNVI